MKEFSIKQYISILAAVILAVFNSNSSSIVSNSSNSSSIYQ